MILVSFYLFYIQETEEPEKYFAIPTRLATKFLSKQWNMVRDTNLENILSYVYSYMLLKCLYTTFVYS